MKKPRSNSKLDQLPPNQREMLIRWLTEENVSYDDAKKRLKEDFNVSTSLGALSRFYATKCFLMRAGEARAFAELVTQQAKEGGGDFDEATLALVKQRAFERAVAKDGDIDELATLAGIIGESAKLDIKRRALDQTDRRIALLERAEKERDAAKATTENPTLTDAEKMARYREIFGMTP